MPRATEQFKDKDNVGKKVRASVPIQSQSREGFNQKKTLSRGITAI